VFPSFLACFFMTLHLFFFHPFPLIFYYFIFPRLFLLSLLRVFLAVIRRTRNCCALPEVSKSSQRQVRHSAADFTWSTVLKLTILFNLILRH
jgi:hypothetical protein